MKQRLKDILSCQQLDHSVCLRKCFYTAAKSDGFIGVNTDGRIPHTLVSGRLCEKKTFFLTSSEIALACLVLERHKKKASCCSILITLCLIVCRWPKRLKQKEILSRLWGHVEIVGVSKTDRTWNLKKLLFFLSLLISLQLSWFTCPWQFTICLH